ncbi:hypothetical protein F4821DRAFT_279567 [Hypoxylon rubiginosum]|uniref:Uncharacterized protein n=1 Tax=Hypoxylon rubiginosum TaxID=110542 RepID=A0ACC0DHM0_9PEZI|nr:hypothetical protein F4821DRAFT_279567 [Hypoxylon rubiginosum]
MGRRIRSSIFLIVNLIAAGLAETSDFQTCFKIDGSVLPDTFRCDNRMAGHSSCCSAGRTCWSNGVCQGESFGVKDWLREGCTDYTWKDPACFDVCSWDTRFHALGVRPCGGITQSNVYCCDNGTTGPGSFACCNNDSSTFTYENITSLPTIIATLPLHDVSPETSKPSSTLQPTVQSTAQSITTSTGSTDSGSPHSSPAHSVGIGVGVGLGLPAAAVIIGGIWWIISRSKRKQLSMEKGAHELASSNYSDTSGWGQQGQQQLAWLADPQEVSEMNKPSELASSHEYSELPALPPRLLRTS